MLNENISAMLDKEYMTTLQEIARAQAGSEEAKWQLQKLTELHRQRMNENQEHRDDHTKFEELELKRAQIREGKLDRYTKIGLEVGVFLTSCAFSAYWMGKGLKFEETGSFTSRVGNWVSNYTRMFRK